MDPPASFKIPIMLRRRGVTEHLNGKVQDRLHSSLAFTSPVREATNEKNWHEISPRLTMRLNPGYRLETLLARSEMRRQYPNHFKVADSPSPDKYFFKKKDEMVTYTESFFKNKILYSKK
jgi:hypothetical protein